MKKAIATAILLLILATMVAVFNARSVMADGLEGDINGDGKVEGLDVVILAKYWGSVSGDGRYDADYDLNADGKIDGLDIAVVAAHFGESI
jgi:hypothetical protein